PWVERAARGHLKGPRLAFRFGQRRPRFQCSLEAVQVSLRIAYLQLAPRHAFAAGGGDVNPALAATIGLFQEPALGVVELPHSAVDGQGDKPVLDQANHFPGPVGRRTASGTGTSANSQG